MSEEKRLKERLLALAADCRNQGAFTGRSYSAIATDLEQLASEVDGSRGMSEEWTQERLDERLAYWQKVLRLQDWDVKVTMERQSRFSSDSNQGECRWTLSKKAAHILVLDPIDYPTDTGWKQDIEQTLVHELLHLHSAPFDNFDTGSSREIALEQSIDCTAKAFVALDRR